jgi:methionyl-tRNA formyltransferase
MKTVAVLGKGSLAIAIAHWFRKSPRWDLQAVLPVDPEPDWGASFKSWADVRRVPITCWNCFSANEYGPYDLVMLVGYDKILKHDVIQFHKRVLNVHFSLLPKYRGMRPVNWALKNGEREHGVTIHEVTPGIDDGPILIQKSFSINPTFDEVEDVYLMCKLAAIDCFLKLMDTYNLIVPQSQDHDAATYYSKDDIAKLGDRSGWTRSAG